MFQNSETSVVRDKNCMKVKWKKYLQLHVTQPHDLGTSGHK